MEDVALNRGEEKTDKVVDSKYLQPRWCPPGLTHTQKCKLQCLWLAEMREKEQEKRRDEMFDEINPRTPRKQEWKRKRVHRSVAAKLATSGQTATSDSPTATSSGPSSSTAPSGGLTAIAQEAHILTEDQSNPTAAPSRQHVEAGSQIVSLGGPTASSSSPTVRPPTLAGPTASSCSPWSDRQHRLVQPPALVNRVMILLITFIRPLIMHQVVWLIKF
jgi:hypothetical protein